MSLKEKFAAANTTLDGRLTKDQAETAGMKMVVKHYDEIDTNKLGYVTFDQLKAYRADKKAAAED